MAKHPTHRFIIRLAKAEQALTILKFHLSHVGDYLWPRKIDEIESMIEDECLYELVKKTKKGVILVGICYIAHAEEPDSQAHRKEFGGIFLLPKYRGKKLGLAKVFGMAVLCEHFIWDSSNERMIAHVHEENMLPRRFLTEDLGFKEVGKEMPPAHVKVPSSMKRNQDGEVVGLLYEFQREKLADFAKWLTTFKGVVEGEVKSKMRLELGIGKNRKKAAKALSTLIGR